MNIEREKYIYKHQNTKLTEPIMTGNTVVVTVDTDNMSLSGKASAEANSLSGMTHVTGESGMKPGYAYVVPQAASAKNLYSPEAGLKQGTLYPELDLSLGVYGMEEM